MARSDPSSNRSPMPLVDQHGGVSFAWLAPGTFARPEHILPAVVYGEVCRAAGVDPRSPWVEFPDRRAALAALAAACQAVWFDG
jgi:hypothetical protein